MTELPDELKQAAAESGEALVRNLERERDAERLKDRLIAVNASNRFVEMFARVLGLAS